jgi:hypothetical protein
VSDSLPEPRPDVPPPAPVDPVTAALRLRASDADREKVAGLLRDAFAEGRLSPVEHDERLSQVYQAQTYGELVPVLHDLPVPPGSFTVPGVANAVSLTQPAPVARRSTGAIAVDPSLAGQAQGPAVAIFSGVERKGRWVVPESMACVAVMGGIELDFSEVVLTARETTVQVFALMGGMDITVPDGVAVRMDAFGFMGGTAQPKGDAPPDAPVIRFQGVAIMGGIDVHRPRRKKRDGDPRSLE